MWKRRSPKTSSPRVATQQPAPQPAMQPAPQPAMSTSEAQPTHSAVYAPPLPEGWTMHSSTQYPGRYFYLHADTQTSQWERPSGPLVAPAPAPILEQAQQEDGLMGALERAQAAGDEDGMRQIIEKLNARAAAAAAGHPEPQPETQPKSQPVSELASQSASVDVERVDAGNAAIEAATKTALNHAAETTAKAAEGDRRRPRGSAKKQSKQQQAQTKTSKQITSSPSKISRAERKRAAAAAAQAKALLAADEQPELPSATQDSPGGDSKIDSPQRGATSTSSGYTQPRYKALAAGVIRQGVEMDSDKAGKLVVGEEFVALATQVTGDTTRIQCDRGWVSVLAKSGKRILQLVDQEDVVSSSSSLPPPSGSSSDSDSDSDSEVVTAAAEAETWRVVRGGACVNTELPLEELARRRKWVLDVPLFSGLDEGLADAIARVLEPRKVERKTVVIAKGVAAEQEMYFVAKGEVEVHTSLDTPPFATLGVGKFVGESSLLDSAPRNAFVFARKAALLYVLRKSDLKPILQKSPEAEAQMISALQQHLSERAEQRVAMEHLFQGGRLWKALLGTSSDDESQKPGGSSRVDESRTDEVSSSAIASTTGTLPQQLDEQRKQSQVAAAPRENRPKPSGKNASSTDSPVKRSVAMLKAASAEDKLIKAGDNSRVPEALRLYTEVLEVLEEALASAGASTKIKETLGKKEKVVRKRIKLLAEAHQALESAHVAAEKAQQTRIEVEEEVASMKAATADEQSILTVSQRARDGDVDSAPKTSAQLPESQTGSIPDEPQAPTGLQTAQDAAGELSGVRKTAAQLPESTAHLNSEESKPVDLTDNGEDVRADERASNHVGIDQAGKSAALGLPPPEPAPQPNGDTALQKDAAAFFANLQPGGRSKRATSEQSIESTRDSDCKSTPGKAEQLQQPLQPDTGSQLEPETNLASQPETESVGFKVVMDWTPRTVEAATHLPGAADGGPLHNVLMGAGMECEAEDSAGGPRIQRVPGTRTPDGNVSPRLRNRPPTLILNSEEVLPSASTVRASSSTASTREPRVDAKFYTGQSIEVLSETLGGWQKAMVTAVTREMIRVEYAGRHRYIDLYVDGNLDPLPWRIPPPVAKSSSSASEKMASHPRGGSPTSTGSPKPSSLRSPMTSSTDWELTQLRPGLSNLRALSPGSSPLSSMDGELTQLRAKVSRNSDVYELEALVSSQLQMLLNTSSQDGGGDNLLQDLGSALAVLDQTVQAVGKRAPEQQS